MALSESLTSSRGLVRCLAGFALVHIVEVSVSLTSSHGLVRFLVPHVRRGRGRVLDVQSWARPLPCLALRVVVAVSVSLTSSRGLVRCLD